MTLFTENDFEDCPVLHRWSIIAGDGGYPFITGQHSFHEGIRTAIDEVYIIDPLLRWVITNHGGYRLAGSRRAIEIAEYGVNRQ